MTEMEGGWRPDRPPTLESATRHELDERIFRVPPAVPKGLTGTRHWEPAEVTSLHESVTTTRLALRAVTGQDADDVSRSARRLGGMAAFRKTA